MEPVVVPAARESAAGVAGGRARHRWPLLHIARARRHWQSRASHQAATTVNAVAKMTEFQPPYFPPPFPSSMALGQHSELFQPAIPDPYQHFHQATAQTFPYRMALEAQQEQMQQEQEQTDYPENAQSAHQRELIKRELASYGPEGGPKTSAEVATWKFQPSDVFCSTPGRLSLLSSTSK